MWGSHNGYGVRPVLILCGGTNSFFILHSGGIGLGINILLLSRTAREKLADQEDPEGQKQGGVTISLNSES
jgi:hypothetical protein